MLDGIVSRPSFIDPLCRLVGISTIGNPQGQESTIRSHEAVMSNEEATDVQLCLFATNLVWQEFPKDVRMRISQLIGVMCIEIIEDLPAAVQETYDES